MRKGILTRVSTTELARELKRRQRRLPALQARRTKLVQRVAEIDRQIAALAGQAVGKTRSVTKRAARVGRGRRRGGIKLVDVLASVLSKDKPVSVREAAAAAQKKGYKSSSKQFRNIVNQTLSKDKRFRKVSRGQYALAA